jgi:hypothetical protein
MVDYRKFLGYPETEAFPLVRWKAGKLQQLFRLEFTDETPPAVVWEWQDVPTVPDDEPDEADAHDLK